MKQPKSTQSSKFYNFHYYRTNDGRSNNEIGQGKLKLRAELDYLKSCVLR
jgi:hypothetical protein